MIALIKGEVEEKLTDRVIISVQGLGYEVYATTGSLGILDSQRPARLYIYEQIKEDAHDLYGFVSIGEKQLFEKLLSVKNVGPRMAMAVMNIGSEQNVRQAIAGGDAKLLQSAKGVGRRVAEQIVVELRDKVGLSSTAAAEAIVGRGAETPGDEAVEALVSLGYSVNDAKIALDGIDSSLTLEERITKALKGTK